MTFGQFISYYKRKNVKTFYKNCDLKTNIYWKVKFLKQAIYIRYVLAKLSKFFQISTLTFSDPFLQRIP